MPFVNDPAVASVPKVGQGVIDCAWRSKAGEAVLWDGSDNDALAEFIGSDRLVVVAGDVYQKDADGVLRPIAKPNGPTIVFKPCAGDWSFVDEHTFTTEYAYHVILSTISITPTTMSTTTSTAGDPSTVTTTGYVFVEKTPAEMRAEIAKPAVKKSPTKKVAPAKKAAK